MAVLALIVAGSMRLEHRRWENGHGFRATPTPQIVEVIVPVDGTPYPAPTPWPEPTAWPQPTPWPEPTAQIVYLTLPPEKCFVAGMRSVLTVGEQTAIAAAQGVLVCDEEPPLE